MSSSGDKNQPPSSSPSSFLEKEQGDMVQRQQSTSQRIRSGTSLDSNTNTDSMDEQDFLSLQRQTFDDMADWFASGQGIPDELIPIYQYLTRSILDSYRSSLPPLDRQEDDKESEPLLTDSNQPVRILDVACGAGALWDFLLRTKDDNLDLDITGVDLSPKMVQVAQTKADTILSDKTLAGPQTTIRVVESDILDYCATDKSSSDENEKEISGSYDVVISNASFGNFFNPGMVLQHMADHLLRQGGKLYITHPLGAAFVKQLHESSPETVPHLLPASVDDWVQLTLGLPLRVDRLDEAVDIDGERRDVYLAELTRVRYKCLDQVVRLRGKVDEGYGRGGKKLGFPTANLPSSFFQDALEEVPTGVYFGWAVLETDQNGPEKKGRNVPHKAVVNVGYSPTFEGQENPEKIVEAHLIFDTEDGSSPLDPPDFYGEVMRLQLHGYLRPEIKFPSFPALIAQITADKEDSQQALDYAPYSTMKLDTFLSSATPWIGKDGGDDSASWEFEDFSSALESL